MLSSGARKSDLERLNEAETHASGSGLLTSFETTRNFVTALSAVYGSMDEDTFDEAEGGGEANGSKFVTEMNRKAILMNINSAIATLHNLAPDSLIAPNDYAYSMTDQPWHMLPHEHDISINLAASNTPTLKDNGTGLLAARAYTAGSYYQAIQLYDDSVATSANAYNTVPPKSDVYDWYVKVSVALSLFNDNGTGTQGDVAAANTAYLAVRAWSAETLGGTQVGDNVEMIHTLGALTAAGDETHDVSLMLDVPIAALAADVTKSKWLHVDFAIGGVTTAGVAGLALTAGSAVEFQCVGLVGYPKERQVAYSNITYRDSAGTLRSINKSDKFIDLYGKLTINHNDDPNFSVDALYRDRVGASGHLVGAMISLLKEYGSKYQDSTNTIDQKYIRLQANNGITDLIGVRHFLNKDKSPFGESSSNPVTGNDNIAELIATLINDFEYFRDMFDMDANFAAQAVKTMSFLTSSNV
jgi:hypothetical protein